SRPSSSKPTPPPGPKTLSLPLSQYSFPENLKNFPSEKTNPGPKPRSERPLRSLPSFVLTVRIFSRLGFILRLRSPNPILFSHNNILYPLPISIKKEGLFSRSLFLHVLFLIPITQEKTPV
ncbi:hypothetical protein F2P56_015882, partial [Juglans regia]